MELQNRNDNSGFFSLGFNLVEMAIVVSVIGLVAGGILVGRELYDIAQIRNTIKQLESYDAAIAVFIGKYGYLPGDIPDNRAIAYGLADPGCPSATLRGCGGNSDGRLEYYSNISSPENVNFWYHLSVSDLIGESLNSGLNDDGSSNYQSGLTIPQLDLRDIGIPIFYWPNIVTGSLTFTSVFGIGKNMYGIGRLPNYFSEDSSGITGREAYFLDSKIDDGFPRSGAVSTFGKIAAFTTSCIDNTVTPNVYIGNGSVNECVILIDAYGDTI